MDAHDHLKRILGPLERRIRNMLMRATLTGVDDTQDLQQFQVQRLEDDVLEGVERIGQYGLASVPPIGAEVVLGNIGSNADHPVVLGVDDKSRPHPLTPGQTVIYDSAGTKITLDAAGNIHILATGTTIVSGSTVVIDGTCQVDGDMHVTGNVVIGGTLNGHTP